MRQTICTIHTYTYAQTYIYIYICVCVCINIYICVCMCVCVFTPPHCASRIWHRVKFLVEFDGSKCWVFLPKTFHVTNVKEPCLPNYLFIIRGWIVGCIPFWKVLVLWEMQLRWWFEVRSPCPFSAIVTVTQLALCVCVCVCVCKDDICNVIFSIHVEVDKSSII